MNIQVHYQQIEQSPWMEEFMFSKAQKLKRYLNGSSSILITVRFENRAYSTTLAIHNLNRDYAFSCEGENLYEAFAGCVDKAARALSEHKKMIKDKINRRYLPVNRAA